MALLHLAVSWAREKHSSLRLSVLTVDHGLRAEAAAEARQVGQWAGAVGLTHHILTWSGARNSAGGLQARARAARYRLMTGWCQAHAAGMLLTAHTMDDQAETVLMRLGRTLSPDSLAGVAALGEWEGIVLCRPLLKARRRALRAYLSGLGQSWIEDPSNEDRRFERVRARHALASPGMDDSVTPERLAALAEAGARTGLLLQQASTRWLSMWLREEDAGLCHVPVGPFASLPQALQEKILSRIIRHYGGGQFQPEPREIRRLARWMGQGGGQARCTLGGAVLGRRTAGVWVTREAGRIVRAPVFLPSVGETLWDNRFWVKAAPGSRITPAGERRREQDGDVPAFARRSWPWVEQPPGTVQPAEIRFLRLLAA